MGTRVLKIHVEAAEKAIPEAMAALRVTNDRKVFAEIMARAVVTAADGKPAFAGVVVEGKRVWIFGPYMSAKAARNALKKGLLGTKREGVRGYAAPLIPAPKMKYLNRIDTDGSIEE